MDLEPPASFPPRSERDVLDFVIDAFPFPLAITYARLQEELDRQEPIAAAWQLRDAFEALIKFVACVAVADALHARPDAETTASLASLLLKPQGLSLGDWHSLVEMPLKPLAPLAKAGRLADGGRLLPELFAVFFEPRNGKRSALNRRIDGDDQSFVPWRNRVFGHGVFRNDRAWYARETEGWLGPLHRFYQALRPVLDGWRLLGGTPGGERVDWQGARGLARTEPHAHEPWGTPLSMILAHDDGRELPFGPMLSVQHCAICNQPAAFFFDKNKYDRKKDRHRTIFLEYLGGHDREHLDWDLTRALASHLPAAFEWTRQVHDPNEIAEGVRIVFRDFEDEYRRPDYLLDALWEAVESRPSSYILLAGPAGMGKTYVVRGLEREGPERRVPVLAHFLLPGTSGHYQTFMTELNDRAREQLRLRTPDIQAKGAATPEALQDEFVDYLSALMRSNKLDGLIVALDALDELPEPAPATPAITDFLPPPDRLPEGCVVLLTGRDELRPRTRADLDRIQRAAPDGVTMLRVDPAAGPNRDLLRAYLLDADRLPAPFRTRVYAEAIIDRAGGVFLYAYHLSRALAAGAFTDIAALPEGGQFYPAYLSRLRARVGDLLYETAYLPALLLLCAAYQPVSLRQLQRWGLARDRLPFVLLDLHDFLRVHRVRRWHDSLADPDAEPENRYEIAHEAFVRFVRDDAELAPLLRLAHARTGFAALPAPSASWTDLDPTDDALLYDLRHALPHLRDSDREDAYAMVLRDETYASACWSAGLQAFELTRYQIAEDLADRALHVYRELVEREGRAEMANPLAYALTDKGAALASLGRMAEAVAVIDEAIALRRRLVERNGHAELANDLAMALGIKANAMKCLGRMAEAVAVCNEAINLLRQLVEHNGRAELANHLAAALMVKSVASQGLGRMAEAMAVIDEAIDLRRRLVEREGRAELANDLAYALMNKGVALCSLGRLAETVAVIDEAIDLRRRLVEREGRAELANDLANALMNKGVALRGMGRMAEAVAVYDEAIDLLRRLVEREGRAELANDLAATLMNKGVALRGVGRMAEAVAMYDEAIDLLRRLVEREGRAELANDLAKALVNKALVLEKQEQWSGALDDYEEAIHWQDTCVRAGMSHLLGDLLKYIRYRLMTLLDLRRWDEAANDVVRYLEHAVPAFQTDEPPAPVSEENESFLRLLRGLPDEAIRSLEPGLGDWVELVQKLTQKSD